MTVSHVSTKPNAVWHICLASLEESNELVDVQSYFPLNKTLVVAQWYAKNHTQGAICAIFQGTQLHDFILPIHPITLYIPHVFSPTLHEGILHLHHRIGSEWHGFQGSQVTTPNISDASTTYYPSSTTLK